VGIYFYLLRVCKSVKMQGEGFDIQTPGMNHEP